MTIQAYTRDHTGRELRSASTTWRAWCYSLTTLWPTVLFHPYLSSFLYRIVFDNL